MGTREERKTQIKTTNSKVAQVQASAHRCMDSGGLGRGRARKRRAGESEGSSGVPRRHGRSPAHPGPFQTLTLLLTGHKQPGHRGSPRGARKTDALRWRDGKWGRHKHRPRPSHSDQFAHSPTMGTCPLCFIVTRSLPLSPSNVLCRHEHQRRAKHTSRIPFLKTVLKQETAQIYSSSTIWCLHI